MLKIKNLDLKAGTPRIAVSFRDNNSLQTIEELSDSALDIAELRVDLFDSLNVHEVRKEVGKFKNVPTLLTLRSEAEHGGWRRSETERLALFEALIPHVDAVDVELYASEIVDAVLEKAEEHHCLKIISYHNFVEMPPYSQLESIIFQAKEKRADIVKIAVQISNNSDLRSVTQLLLQHNQKNLIVIAMGKQGLLSRVFFPALGSLVTFAYLDQPSAPGQLQLDAMSGLLKQFCPQK